MAKLMKKALRARFVALDLRGAAQFDEVMEWGLESERPEFCDDYTHFPERNGDLDFLPSNVVMISMDENKLRGILDSWNSGQRDIPVNWGFTGITISSVNFTEAELDELMEKTAAWRDMSSNYTGGGIAGDLDQVTFRPPPMPEDLRQFVLQSPVYRQWAQWHAEALGSPDWLGD